MVVVFSGQIEQGDRQQHAQRYAGFHPCHVGQGETAVAFTTLPRDHLFMGIAIMLDC